MAEHKITLEEQQQHPALSVAKDRGELYVRLRSGSRHSTYRLSQKELLLLLLLGCSALIVLYAYWDIRMMATLAGEHSDGAMEEPLAQRLAREVRVVCFVLTTPKYHKSRAVHIQRTWGKRCNKIYFMTSAHDEELNETVVQKTPDKYEVLWGKTKEAFTFLYEHKRHEGDWFMKADDDTYVFVENLRHMLYPYSPQMPIYFGFNFHLFNSQQKNASYMSGGSGYVLSSEALRQFVHGLNDSSKCRQQDDSAEDLEAGACLFNLNVPAGDSRDSKLRYRFFPLAPYSQLLSHYTGLDFWFFKYAFYNSRACRDCLSNYPVAFHYIDPDDLYVFDYLSYTYNLHGRKPELEQLPPKIAPGNLYIPPSDN